MDDLIHQVLTGFRASFGCEPLGMAVAPGRVNLIGDHVDYEGGYVLPMAIEKWTVVAVGPGEQGLIRGVSSQTNQRGSGQSEWFVGSPRDRKIWLKYVAGVLDGYQSLGWDCRGLNVSVSSSLPIGAGLSSSAALEMATAIGLEQLGAPVQEPKTRAQLCQKAEHEYAGVPCGIMDQLTVGCGVEGHAMLIDCRSLEFEPIPLSSEVVCLVIGCGVQHDLGESGYPQRRAQCAAAAKQLGVQLLREAGAEDLDRIDKKGDGEIVYRRARHVVREIARTTEAAGAIQEGDWLQVGKLMSESHASLRDDFESSCPEMDALVAICDGIGRSGGIYGARMTGGGFGGSAIALVEGKSSEFVRAQIRRQYLEETGLEVNMFQSRPAHGARSVSF
jgi:galactokinase